MFSLLWRFIVCFTLICLSAKADHPNIQLRKVYQDLLKEKYVLLPHKGTFLLPFSYNDNPNRRPYRESFDQNLFNERGKYVRNVEAEMQISFLILTSKNIFGTKFNTFLGYTQHSWWQVYNEGWSRQFRETNYEPEIFFRRVFDEENRFLGLDFIGYDLGFVHQSNGQAQELSRSWNRIFARAAFVVDRFVLTFTSWYRIPSSGKTPDDNPDLYKYLGYGNLNLRYSIGKSNVGLLYRIGEKYQGVDLSYSYPWKEGIRFYIKGTYGYGSSMIDYNNRAETIGVGISLADPLSGFLTNMEGQAKGI